MRCGPLSEDKSRVPELDRSSFACDRAAKFICAGGAHLMFIASKKSVACYPPRFCKSAKSNKMTYALWHDANGNGRVDDGESTPTEMPGSVADLSRPKLAG